MAREKTFHNYYESQKDSSPDHIRLLSGSKSSSDQRYIQVMNIVGPIVRQERPRSRILDFGCGLGRYCEAIAEHDHQVIGFDYFEKFVTDCKKRAASKGLDIDYQVGSYQQLDSLGSNNIDGIISVGVLQNIDSPTTAIKNIYKTLKPSGFLCLETLNRNSIVNRLFNKNADMAFYKPQEFADLCENIGFNTVNMTHIFILPEQLKPLSKLLTNLAKISILKPLLSPFAHGFLYYGRKPSAQH